MCKETRTRYLYTERELQEKPEKKRHFPSWDFQRHLRSKEIGKGRFDGEQAGDKKRIGRKQRKEFSLRQNELEAAIGPSVSSTIFFFAFNTVSNLRSYFKSSEDFSLISYWKLFYFYSKFFHWIVTGHQYVQYQTCVCPIRENSAQIGKYFFFIIPILHFCLSFLVRLSPPGNL